MKQLLLFAAGGLVSLLPALPAAAQVLTPGPWVELPTAPLPITTFVNAQLQSPLANVVWAKNFGFNGQNSYYTTVTASTDNGLSWRQATLSADGNKQDALDLWALDGQRAWLLTQDHITDTRRLWQTTTGPTGFALLPTPPSGAQFVRFFDAATAVLVAANEVGTPGWRVFRSTDGGQSWQPAPGLPALAAGDQPASCTTLGPQLWVATTQGNLLLTPDAGLTWRSAPTPQPLTNLAFRDAQHGLASADQYILPTQVPPLYRTTDGGGTWQLVNPTGPHHPSSPSSLAAFVGSAGTYLSVSDYYEQPGTVVSYDDGQTWRDLGGTATFTCVCTNTSGQAWAAYAGSGLPLRLGSTALPTAAPQAAPTALAYPSPTTGPLRLPAAGDYRSVTVYDATGRPCRTATLGATSTTIDLHELGAGLYLLRFAGSPVPPLLQRVVVQ